MRRVVTVLLPLLAGCGPKVSGACDPAGDETCTADTGDTALDETTSGPVGSDTTTTGGPPPIRSDRVDILFVIDNSGSMEEEQGLLAHGGAALLEPLDQAGIDWRIGFTTTDNNNPWCTETTPEAGKLVATSCRSRPADFIFPGTCPIEYCTADEACLDNCSHDEIAVFRPWLESVDGEPSWSGPATPAEAFACLAPQGINGCGFESQLESIHKAIRRSETEGEEQFGFLRPDTLTVIVVLTDEADCSHNSDHEEIFLPQSEGGTTTFWSDPLADTPTSAVCWYAGVACSGGGSPYDECHAVNLDPFGAPVSDERARDDAVLLPVSRYIDAMRARPTLFAGIVGVGPDGKAVYADTVADPTFQFDFGIGPGCTTSPTRTAVPPVRIREVSEALGGTLYSVCSDDYRPALADIAERTLQRLAAG